MGGRVLEFQADKIYQAGYAEGYARAYERAYAKGIKLGIRSACAVINKLISEGDYEELARLKDPEYLKMKILMLEECEKQSVKMP